MGLEHPDITRMLRYGTLSNVDDTEVKCPVCGKECEKFFKQHGEILGCDRCIDEEYVY